MKLNFGIHQKIDFRRLLHLDCLYTFLLALMPFPWINKYYYALLFFVFIVLFFFNFLVKKETFSFISFCLYFFAIMYGFVTVLHESDFSLTMAVWLSSLALLFNDKNKYIFISYFISLLFFFSLTVILAFCGVTPNQIRFGKNYLGFPNPNTAGMIAFNLLSLFLFIRRGRISYLEIVLAALFVTFIYRETGSDTCLSVSCIELFLAILFKLFKRKIYAWECLPKTLESLPFVFAVLSFILVCLYRSNPGLFTGLYPTLLSRLSYVGNNGLLNSLSLLGVGSTNYGPLDNAYAFALIENGVVGFLLVMAYYSFTLHVLNKKHSYFVFMLLVCVLIYGIAESTVVRLSYTMSLLFLLDKNQPTEYEQANHFNRGAALV